jgi:mRNA interferase MazF
VGGGPEPFRGEVWDVRFPGFGEHPAVVLSINALNVRLGHVAVLPVTGTPGPPLTHLPLTADAGLTRYDESFVDITGLQPVARGRLLRRRGLLTHGELEHIGASVRTYLGL